MCCGLSLAVQAQRQLCTIVVRFIPRRVRFPTYIRRRRAELGLQPDVSYELRVSVVQCTTPAGARVPYCYIDIEEQTTVAWQRATHVSHRHSFYRQALAPQPIRLVWSRLRLKTR